MEDLSGLSLEQEKGITCRSSFKLKVSHSFLWDKSQNPWEDQPQQYQTYDDASNMMMLSSIYPLYLLDPQNSNYQKVDIGDYTVSFAEMIQYKNQDHNLQRRIKILYSIERVSLPNIVEFKGLVIESEQQKKLTSKKDFIARWESLKQGTYHHRAGKNIPSVKMILQGILVQQRKYAISHHRIEDIQKSQNQWKGIFQNQHLTDKNINELFDHSMKSKAIANLIVEMYSMQTFLYCALNDSIRNNDQSKLCTLGPFAQILLQSVSYLSDHQNQISACIYHGCRLPQNIVNKMSIGKSISFNGFFSFTQDL